MCLYLPFDVFLFIRWYTLNCFMNCFIYHEQYRSLVQVVNVYTANIYFLLLIYNTFFSEGLGIHSWSQLTLVQLHLFRGALKWLCTRISHRCLCVRVCVCMLEYGFARVCLCIRACSCVLAPFTKTKPISILFIKRQIWQTNNNLLSHECHLSQVVSC